MVLKYLLKKNLGVLFQKMNRRESNAYEWLRDQGLGDIIKNNVFVTFGKGEDNKAKQLIGPCG